MSQFRHRWQPRRKRWLLARLTTLAVGFTLLSPAVVSLAADSKPVQEEPIVLPQAEITTLDGDSLGGNDFAGKAVLFDFWATWCKPCIEAIPHLGGLAKTYTDSPFQLVSLSSDLTEEKVRNFVESHDMAWPQVWDRSNLLARELRIVGYPTYLLFDHHGTEIYRVTGWGPGIQWQLDKRIAAAVKEAARETAKAGAIQTAQ